MAAVTVDKFIVIPGNELHKLIIGSNASPRIKGRRVDVPVNVTGEDLVLSVAEDALDRAT